MTGWAYEFKWDGERAVARIDGGRIHLMTRSGKDITGHLPGAVGAGRARRVRGR